MEYKTVIRCSGVEFVGVHKSAYKSALSAKKGLKLPKKVHVSMALVLDGTEIFRSHGLGLVSAFWSFKQNLRRMKPESNLFKVKKIIDDFALSVL
jgi:hypothetical protein